ncbi:hypothetical protein D3C85_1284630 [compost metagenome]
MFKVCLFFLNITFPINAPVTTKAKISGDTMIRQMVPSPRNKKLSTMAKKPFNIEYQISFLLLSFKSLQNHEANIPIKIGRIINSEKTKTPPLPAWSTNLFIPIMLIIKKLGTKKPNSF